MRFVKYLTLLCCLLFAGGTIKAQDTHWNFDAYAFEYDMTAYLTVEYDGKLVDDLFDYEVAAFADDECRGVSQWVNTETSYPYLYMRIRSNQEQGESVKFKVYQKSKDKEIECDGTISFENRSVIGLPSSPQSVKLKVETFTVTVETLGKGTVIGAGIYKEGESFTLTATPAEGWRFEKWSDGTTSPTYTMTVNSDKALTAEFVRNSYVVSFVVDGTTISEQTLEYEARIEIPSVPKKEGYTFSGFGDVDETVPARDVTYTGTYVANKYKVTFIADGVVISETEMEFGTEITVPDAPTKEGYTFVGWGEVDKTVPTHDVTYTAEYKVNIYKLTYEVDGETYHSEDIAFGTSITSLAEPQSEGKTFSGWSVIPATMPAHDVKITGSFSVNSYMVRFVVDDKVVYENLQAYGSKIVVPSVDDKEGYTFSGFGEVDETVPAHDVIYTAAYNVNSYKLTYFLNGELFAEDSIAYDSVIIPREVPNSDKEQFSGWEGLPEVMPAHDVVVYGSTTTTGFHIVGKNKQLVTVYSVNGTIIKRNVDRSCLEKLLSPGLYVISGKKVLIK